MLKRHFWPFLAFLAFLTPPPAAAGVNCTLPFVLQNGTLADAGQVMANFDEVVACLMNAAGAGNNTDIISLNALQTPLTPTQGGTPLYLGGISTGTNDLTIPTTVPSGFVQVSQYVVAFYASATNTGEMSININGTGQTAFYNQTPQGPQKMTGGEVIGGQLILAAYNNTIPTPPTSHPTWNAGWYECISCGGIQHGGFGPQTGIASAPTVDLGTIGSHNVVIGAGTPITNFGATASSSFPMYFVGFAAGTTITFNNTNCMTVGGCIFTPGNANIVTQAGDTAWLMYLGTGSSLPASGNWQILFYQRATGAAIVNPTPNCGFNNLQWANGSSATTVTISWGSASLTDPTTNVAIYSPGVTGKTLNIGIPGPAAGGMDGGGTGSNAFVYMYGISNGNSFDVMGSNNGMAPAALPPAVTGPPFVPAYHYYCRLGAIKTNQTSAGSLVGMYAKGANARYVPNGPGMPMMGAYFSIASGPSGGALAQIQGSGYFAPPTASMADLVLSVGATGTLAHIEAASGGLGALAEIGSVNTGAVFYRHLLDSTGAVFYTSSGGSNGNLAVVGYTDQVNAN